MGIINKDAKLSRVMVDNHTILVIDDFLKKPLVLRKLAIETYTNHKVSTSKFGLGERVESKNEGAVIEIYPDKRKINRYFKGFDESLAKTVDNELGEEIRSHYGLEDWKELGYQKGPYFNCITRPPQFLPHVDFAHVSSFIYLNSPSQCEGGTAVYRHVPTGKVFVDQQTTSLEWLCEKPLDHPLTDSTGEWELVNLIEMKYNRFVAFNGSLIHKIYWPNGCSFSSNIKLARMAINCFYRYK